MRDSFIFYRSFIEGLEEVDDTTFRRLVEAITYYALDDVEPTLSGLEKGMFRSWKANVDASNKRRDNGKLGGRPPKEKTNGYEDKNHRLEDEKPNKNDNDNENVNENVNVTATQGDATAAARKQIAEEWNKTSYPSITRISANTERYERLNARLKEYGLDDVLKAIHIADKSAYLHGQTWFTFDWFIRPNNFIKVLDGNYTDRASPEKKNNKIHFDNERDYDMDDLEKRMLEATRAKNRRDVV